MRVAIGLIGMLLWLLLPAIGLAAIGGAIRLSAPATALLVLGIIGSFVAGASYFLPLSVYGDRLKPDVSRVTWVQASGRKIFEIRGAGSLGAIQFTWPLLGIAAYPGGIVFKPAFLQPIALRRDEVTSVERRRQFLERVVDIHHRSAEVESPITISAAFGGEAIARNIEKDATPSSA